MDKLDEWMKRAEGVGNTNQNNTSKPQASNIASSNKPEKGSFSKFRKKFHPKKRKRPFPGTEQKSGNGSPAKKAHKKKHSRKRKPIKSAPHKQSSPDRKTVPERKPAPQRKTVPERKTAMAPILRNKLKIIPLGGLNEVGKNMTAFEYENDIIIIDMGFEFPGEDMLGIDYVIPDVTYLEENKKRIRGVIITHGHLDHIGGVPYILPKLDYPPVYGTKFAMGLVRKRTEEFKQEKFAKLNVIDPDKPLKLGQFFCTFFRVMHSVPDAVGVVIGTPIGKLVHTGDFKFDDRPTRNMNKADMHKIRALGNQNVLALFCESTNALKEGHTMSETDVGKELENVIKDAKGRIIVASFSSQIGRIQQLIDIAEKYNRKIYVSGRSMRENMEIAAKLGYLSVKKDKIQDIKKYKIKENPDDRVMILTTGSQGEAVSALSRIAKKEHPHIKAKKGDTIILSSSPIIGNERAISTVINNLCILGATVIHNQIMDVHTSGHAKQDELIEMIKSVNPRYLVPIHGEYYMRQALSLLAQKKCGIPENRIIMLENGDVLIAEKGKLEKSNEKIETKYILIDGRGEGQMGSRVQVDREMMSLNGALIILVYVSKKGKKPKKDPDVVSRGFIYMHESDEVTQEISQIAKKAYKTIMDKNPGANRNDIKKFIKQSVDKYTHKTLERRPLIIPLIVEI